MSNAGRPAKRHDWVSVPAIAWVLDDAPNLPPQLVSTLLAFARRSGPEGANSYPSLTSVAWVARKSLRQVKRDVIALQKLGLLLPGDPQAVSHLPVDKRPNVYDLPIWLRRGDTHDTPPGDTHDTPRGDMEDQAGCHPWSSGVSPTTPKEDKNNPMNKESSARASSSSSTRRDEDDEEAREKRINDRKRRERAKAKRKIQERTDADAEMADVLLDYLVANFSAGTLDRYIDGLPDDDLESRLDEATWELRDQRATHRAWADDLLAKLVENFPETSDATAERLVAAHLHALRQGHTDEAVYVAVNAALYAKAGIAGCINAINALGTPTAARSKES